jgi:hypothetical protein
VISCTLLLSIVGPFHFQPPFTNKYNTGDFGESARKPITVILRDFVAINLSEKPMQSRVSTSSIIL